MTAFSAWKHRAFFAVEDNNTAEGTVDATPRPFDVTPTDSGSTGITIDTVNRAFVITKAGDYEFNGNLSFYGSAANTFLIEVYNNGLPTGFKMERKLGVGGDVGAMPITALLENLAVGDSIQIYRWSSDGGIALTLTNGQFVVERMS